MTSGAGCWVFCFAGLVSTLCWGALAHGACENGKFAGPQQLTQANVCFNEAYSINGVPKLPLNVNILSCVMQRVPALVC